METATTIVLKKIEASDFKEGENELKKDGKTYVLLSDGRIAEVREGKGSDVEKAQMESGGNQSKYMSAMMAATVKISDRATNMYELADLNMKDYMRIQVVFAELNF